MVLDQGDFQSTIHPAVTLSANPDLPVLEFRTWLLYPFRDVGTSAIFDTPPFLYMFD